MSDILRRSSEIWSTQQDQASLRALAEERSEAHKLRLREESGRRAQEYLEYMRQNRIPAKPLYVQEGIPDNYRYSGVSHTNIHYHKVGAGWLVREMSYDYEDGLTPGLFLTEDGRLSNCGEAKNGQLGTSSIRDAEYYEVQGIQTKESTYADSEHTMFAGDAGLEILAHGLAMHHIVG